MFCVDRRGRHRNGEVWVHTFGRTSWVCTPCAELLGKQAGIPSQAQLRRKARAEERRGQLQLDLTPETHSSARPSQG